MTQSLVQRVSDAKSNSKERGQLGVVVDSEDLKFNDDDACGIEYKREILKRYLMTVTLTVSDTSEVLKQCLGTLLYQRG